MHARRGLFFSTTIAIHSSFFPMKRSNFQVVLLLFLWSLAVWAQSPDAIKAIALQNQGRYAEAESAWRVVLKENPHDAAAYASLGVVLSKEEKYAEAASIYRKALVLNPNLLGIQLNLGLAEFKQGRFSAAVVPLRAALKADPSNATVQTLIGMSYYGATRYAEAIPYLKSAIKLSPENLELRSVLAQSCLYSKQYNCTLEQYKQIVAANPDSAQAHMLAGEALDGLSRTSEAIAEFQAAEKAAPDEANVHFGLGYLLWTQHRYQEALQEFELELNNEPNHVQAMAYAGDSQLKLGNNAEAKEILQRAVTQPGATRLAWLDLGIILASENQDEGAVAAYRRAIEMDPAQVDAHWRLARLYRKMGKQEEAKAEFAKASQLHQQKDASLVQQISGPSAVKH